jgi:hypothetical protein
MGCWPKKNLFERSLKRFLFINLGEVKEVRFQLLEPVGRVLESPGTSLRFIKNVSEQAKSDLGNSPFILHFPSMGGPFTGGSWARERHLLPIMMVIKNQINLS